MRFPAPLVEGVLVRRYKRFLADVAMPDGRVETVHVPNPGAMTGVDAPGSRVWLSRSDNPGRKLAHTLEMVEADGLPVGVNTGHPNRIVAEAVAAGRVPELSGYSVLRREVRYGAGSRVDLLLEEPGRRPAYVEVKNVHLRRPHRFDGTAAEFPDAVTARGARHLEELAAMVRAGCRAVMLYLVQRSDCTHLAFADDVDPVYAAGLARAAAAGVEALCYRCTVTPQAIELAGPLPVRLPQLPDPSVGRE